MFSAIYRPVDRGTAELRARSRAAADLAARTRDKDVARLLLIVSDELEEEACLLDAKKGSPQLRQGRPLRSREHRGTGSLSR